MVRPTKRSNVMEEAAPKRYRGNGPVGVSKKVDRALLEQYFDRPIDQAARAIGVSTTIIKRLCRKHGIPRWPYRRLNSLKKELSRRLQRLEALDQGSKEHTEHCSSIQKLEQQRIDIINDRGDLATERDARGIGAGAVAQLGAEAAAKGDTFATSQAFHHKILTRTTQHHLWGNDSRCQPDKHDHGQAYLLALPPSALVQPAHFDSPVRLAPNSLNIESSIGLDLSASSSDSSCGSSSSASTTPCREDLLPLQLAHASPISGTPELDRLLMDVMGELALVASPNTSATVPSAAAMAKCKVMEPGNVCSSYLVTPPRPMVHTFRSCSQDFVSPIPAPMAGWEDVLLKRYLTGAV